MFLKPLTFGFQYLLQVPFFRSYPIFLEISLNWLVLARAVARPISALIELQELAIPFS
jgi:hypothetical protein